MGSMFRSQMEPRSPNCCTIRRFANSHHQNGMSGDISSAGEFWDLYSSARNTWSETAKDGLRQKAFYDPSPDEMVELKKLVLGLTKLFVFII